MQKLEGPGERIAKMIAHKGYCSRREAERLIDEGKVKLNGKLISTPAIKVTEQDRIEIDGEVLADAEPTRLWLYNKPSQIMITDNDPEGRTTLIEELKQNPLTAELELPRLLYVGRLDYTTEGLLLLTNHGGLKRVLELPSTGWVRRYKVRAFGKISQRQLDELKHGITVDKITYGAIDASIEREQGRNVWLNVALREGKNREIKKVLGALDLQVNRLIRVSYGPFQLGDLKSGAIAEVKRKVLRDQLGTKLAKLAGANFVDPNLVPQNTSTATRGPKRKPPSKGGKSFNPQKPNRNKR